MVYGERRSALMESLQEELGTAAEISGGEAGMHLAVILDGIQDKEIAAQAARENLWLVPLSPSYLGKNARQGFILGFGSTRAEEIPAAVRKLKSVLEAK